MADFEKSVFINCPFDDLYLPILRALLFTVIDLGFWPRIALESLNSGIPRITKIVELIEASKYAIHDLSRLKATREGEYFRLNMPLELGIDIGCRLFKGGRWSEKKCLILETERFRYQAAISDLSNSDIAVHGDDPIEASAAVRNWLNAEARLRARGPAEIFDRFTDFTASNYEMLTLRGYSPKDITRLPIAELIEDITRWTSEN